jgi:hypothetical protein
MPIIDLPQGRVQYRLAGPASAGPTVVFVHGLLVNSELWTGVADELGRRGVRSYALDLPLGSHPIALRSDADLSPRVPRPKDFADAMTMVPQDTVVESVASGPDPDKHAQQVRQHLDAGVDEVYVQQIGPDMDGFFTSWQRDVLPQLKK